MIGGLSDSMDDDAHDELDERDADSDPDLLEEAFLEADLDPDDADLDEDMTDHA